MNAASLHHVATIEKMSDQQQGLRFVRAQELELKLETAEKLSEDRLNEIVRLRANAKAAKRQGRWALPGISPHGLPIADEQIATLQSKCRKLEKDATPRPALWKGDIDTALDQQMRASSQDSSQADSIRNVLRGL